MIVLKPIDLNDTNNIVSWRNNPRVLDNFIDQRKLDSETHINWYTNFVMSGKVKQYIIHNYEEKIDVGSVFLKDIDYINKQAEFGIFIGVDSQIGKGISKMAIKIILAHAFFDMNLEKVILRVKNENTNAIKLYEKMGFKTYLGENDISFMQILKSEFDKRISIAITIIEN